MQQEIKVGDHVHVGHGVPGGAGARGVVTKIADGAIHFRSHDKDKYGYKNYKGKLENATLEKAVAPRNESVELKEYALEAPTLKKHRIGVRVTDGQTNKRKVKYVVVTHSSDKEGAQKVGEKHFRKKGDFVHGSFHSGMVQEEVDLEEAKGGLTYKQEHSKWGVVPKSSKEFVKFFPKDKESDARAHAEKTGGTLKKIDQAGRAIREDVELDEAQTPYYKKQGWIKKMSQVAKQERLAREKKEKDAQQKSVKEGTELDESLKTHYQNGYDAQKKGKTRQDNPHREGSPAASMWAKGWEHASDKREPQKFANEELQGKTMLTFKELMISLKEENEELQLEDFSIEEIQEFIQTEEFEQLDELSKATLRSYAEKKVAKLHNDPNKTNWSSSQEHGKFKPLVQATRKLHKPTNEEVELDEADQLASRPFSSKNSDGTVPSPDQMKSRQSFLKRQIKYRKTIGGLAGPKKGQLPEEYELEEELKGDMHPDASKVLKHIKPEHHSVYKPYLKKGTYNGSYKDRSDVLKAAEKAGHTVSEEVDLEEGWEDMKKAVAARMAAGDVRDKSKFDKKEYKTGTLYTRKRETFSDEDDAASDKKAEKQAQTATGEAPVKRGRGRPKGSYGSYKQRSAETKAKAAAKSAATKAANKAVKKESFDDAFVSDLFKELRESEEVLDFIDLLNCDEFQSLDEQSLTVLASHIENALNQIKKQNLESLSELEVDDLILEVLSKDASAGDWIGDFIKSDDPRFKGKSKEKRKQMALAAYYAKQRETK